MSKASDLVDSRLNDMGPELEKYGKKGRLSEKSIADYARSPSRRMRLKSLRKAGRMEKVQTTIKLSFPWYQMLSGF